jgi:hypothetical protein
MTESLIITLFIIVGLPLYFAPTIIAFVRNKKNRFPIALVNLVMGYTAIGWVGCMIWACLDKPRS